VRTSLIAIILLAGCASAGAPPGGPEDKLPPRLIRVTPDSNAVNVHDKVATFYFDDVINDRSTGPGDLSSFFLVSPSDGTPRVSWHRRRIDVRPRHGFRDNTAYTITLLPGLSDLRSNAMKTGATLVFATGPTIPTLRIVGTAFDWPAERPAPRAYIEAMTADSITYLAQADSVGHFEVGPLGPGTYLVRAIVDANQNRALDRGEPWDTVRVTTPQPAPLELLTAVRDTLPADRFSVALLDSVTIQVTFDHLLDPNQSFTPAMFRVVGADSVAIPITAIRTPREEAQRTKALAQAALDSARRADSVAGRPRPPVPVVPPSAVAKPAPTPSRPPPITTLTIVLARPLAPNTNYRVSVASVRALNGRTASSTRSFTTPKPPPPKPANDSTAAPRPAPPGGAAAPTAPSTGAPTPTRPPTRP
jgi:hypothetical protein